MMSPKLLFHGIENNIKLNIVVSISRLLNVIGFLVELVWELLYRLLFCSVRE